MKKKSLGLNALLNGIRTVLNGMCLILMRNKVIWAFFKKKNKSELH